MGSLLPETVADVEPKRRLELLEQERALAAGDDRPFVAHLEHGPRGPRPPFGDNRARAPDDDPLLPVEGEGAGVGARLRTNPVVETRCPCLPVDDPVRRS